jgi:ferredoxin
MNSVGFSVDKERCISCEACVSGQPPRGIVKKIAATEPAY